MSAQNAPQGHARRHRDPHRRLRTAEQINFRLWAASIDGTGPFRPLPDSGGPFYSSANSSMVGGKKENQSNFHTFSCSARISE